jgi:hypothetical protein
MPGEVPRIFGRATEEPNARSCRARCVLGLRGGRMRAQCLGMMTFTELPSVSPDHRVPFTGQLRLAVAAYMARFKAPRPIR